MGKPNNKKKKFSRSSTVPKMDLDAAVFLRRAHELKEEGNRRFQSKDYQGAMDQYEKALKLTPPNHPDRAVFHSNRAACLMQMKPVQFDAVIDECGLALQAHPRFGRALFRRAKAFEAIGKLDLALTDVQLLLEGEGFHHEALEFAKRLRFALANREEAQTKSQDRPAAAPKESHAGNSAAGLGAASVVRGNPKSASLPDRPLPKKKEGQLEQFPVKFAIPDLRQSTMSKPRSSALETPEPRGLGNPVHAPRVQAQVKEPLQAKTPASTTTAHHPETRDRSTAKSSEKVYQPKVDRNLKVQIPETLQSRPLKLIYGHDIRLAKLPANSNFRDLRQLVAKRFPSSKAVLIKYKDLEGDLITITSTEELRFAEATAAIEAATKKTQFPNTNGASLQEGQDSKVAAMLTGLEPLRFHVVEVTPDQEPVVQEGEVLDDPNVQKESSLSVGAKEAKDGANPKQRGLTLDLNAKASLSGKAEKGEESGKEIEIDEWLLDFAHLFRTHVGIDPDGHVDLQELGMELCSEALEETMTSEEAQHLFELAACKFQEVAALAFFNWGNVYMCSARKRIPLEDNSIKVDLHERLLASFDWAQGQYLLAEKKYEEALRVKPDFYEGTLALGQQKFESAKLRWSLAVTSQVDFNSWDASEVLTFFSNAEERMEVAAEMWEKLEQRRLKERDSVTPKKKDLKGYGGAAHELSEAETLEHFTVTRSQINLFWGNILFEHSQVECKLGLPSWKLLLDAAVQKLELAGASPSDIGVVLKNHISNSSGSEKLTEQSTSVSDPTPGREESLLVQENGQSSAPASRLKLDSERSDDNNLEHLPGDQDNLQGQGEGENIASIITPATNLKLDAAGSDENYIGEHIRGCEGDLQVEENGHISPNIAMPATNLRL